MENCRWQSCFPKLSETSASEAQEHLKPVAILRANHHTLLSQAKGAMDRKGKQLVQKATLAPIVSSRPTLPELTRVDDGGPSV